MSIAQRLNAAIDTAIKDKRIVGTTILIARNGETFFARAAGLADREAQKPAEIDTIYRLASVTKPVVSTTALVMIDKGLLSLDGRVSDYLTWFHPKGPDGEDADILIRHLLTHTSGLDYSGGASLLGHEAANTGLTDTDLGFEENFARLNRVPLNFRPGSSWIYSVAIDILGAIIAEVSGTSLEAAVRSHVIDPLGMNDTRFSATDIDRLATPYADASPEPERMRATQRVVTPTDQILVFEPERLFNAKAYQSGGAGMAGTAGDMLKLLNTYVTDESTLLKAATKEAALKNQIAPVETGPGTGFGFIGSAITDPAAARTALPRNATTWGGVYGNRWFIDPDSRTVGVIMTNTAIEGCNGAFPEEIWRAVFSD